MSNYITTSKKIMASILFLSQALISCYNPSLPSDQQQHPSLSNVEKASAQPTNISAGPVYLTTREGYQISLTEDLDGGLVAEVYEELPGFTRSFQGLPVYGEPSLCSLETLCKYHHNPDWPKNHVHVYPPKKSFPGCVWIGAKGLLGGMEQDDQDLSKVKRGKTGTPASIKPKKQQEERTEQIELLKPGEEKMDKLSLPDPANLYLKFNDERKNRQVDAEILRATKKVEALDGNRPLQDFQEVINTLMKLATHGEIRAMELLGDICKKQGKLNLAEEWYAWAFESSWLKNPLNAYKTQAYEALKQLNSRIPLLYPYSSEVTPIAQYFRCQVVREFYVNGTALPFLTPKKNELKVKRLEKEMESIKQNHGSGFFHAVSTFNQATNYYQQHDYTNAIKLYSQVANIFPEASFMLGSLHKRGFLTTDPSNSRASSVDNVNDFFLRSATRGAFDWLGVSLCQDGVIERANRQTDCQKAIDYLELSSSPEALSLLGMMHMRKASYESGIKRESNYEKAKYYFEKSNRSEAYYWLGRLYEEGCIRPKASNDNYKAAEVAFGIAAVVAKRYKQPVEDYFTLGQLYLNGYIDKNKQPNYKLAFENFKKVIEVSGVRQKSMQYALHNIGLLLCKGYIDAKGNPNPSKRNCKEALYYLTQADLPESWYILGLLHENGLLEESYNEIGEKLNKYKKAIECYEKSRSVDAKLAIFRLLQLGLLDEDFTLGEYQQYVSQALADINALLPTLPNKESLYYVRGMIYCYTGYWEGAFVCLQQALLLGCKQEGLTKLIEVLSSHLIEEANEKLQEKPKKTSTDSSLTTLPREEDIKKQEVASITSTDSIKPKQKSDISTVRELDIIPIMEEVEAKEIVEEKAATEKPITAAMEVVKAKEPTIEEKTIVQEGIRETASQIRRLNKEQKKLLQEKHNNLGSLKFKEEVKLSQPSPSIEWVFLDERQKEQFLAFSAENNKVKEILEDLKHNPWSTNGVGKPEVLKYFLKGYKGCLSRRINQVDRLIYKVLGPGKILILSWQGHYEK